MATVYDHVLVEKDGSIGIVTLNRPQQLNALSNALIKEICLALEAFDRDSEIRVMILTGGEKVFAAGADIKELSELTPFDERIQERVSFRERISGISKPVIAAVSGFALGGACELAMACDIIIASETARFGQLEINLGIIPGSGGTQRLARTVGKYKAMEMVLTGEIISAADAERRGLANKVVPVELLMEEAKKLANTIAAKPPLAVKLAKEAVLKAANSPLNEGLEFERKSFCLLLGSGDKREGMTAFIEKRKPEFKGK